MGKKNNKKDKQESAAKNADEFDDMLSQIRASDLATVSAGISCTIRAMTASTATHTRGEQCIELVEDTEGRVVADVAVTQSNKRSEGGDRGLGGCYHRGLQARRRQAAENVGQAGGHLLNSGAFVQCGFAGQA